MPTKKATTNKPVTANRGVEETVSATYPVILQQPAPKETVCQVCGHVNKGETKICEMCSNYLFD